MSEEGQTRSFDYVRGMSGFAPKAEIGGAQQREMIVRSTRIRGHPHWGDA
jgi:hypothetical protein